MESEPREKQMAWQSQTADGQVLLSMPWEVFVLNVAALSILNWVLVILARDRNLVPVVVIVDLILSVIFAVDVLRRLRVADDKRAYLIHGYGWLDAISIIPVLRIARILRIAKVSKTLQGVGGPEAAVKAFFANKAAGGLLMIFFIAILVLEFGSLLVLWAEEAAPDATITSAQDAVWYVIVTMSTVGYGDTYPVTELGRVFGALILVVGVAVFGTLTGFLASTFQSSGEPDGSARSAPEEEPTSS